MKETIVLSYDDEQHIKRFASQLRTASGVDDLFPPDGGVREPNFRPAPKLPPLELLVGGNLNDWDSSYFDGSLDYSLRAGKMALRLTETTGSDTILV